jgi:hypothetical protein
MRAWTMAYSAAAVGAAVSVTISGSGDSGRT